MTENKNILEVHHLKKSFTTGKHFPAYHASSETNH